jgi:ribosomal protein RSM22 (predicted rRNA methylase)
VECDLRKLVLPEPHDLVLAPYSLHDLTEREQDRLAEEAWFVARRALLLIQPGTRSGFDAIRRLRSWLTGRGARIQAPCPHGSACPVPPGDLCHFAVRLDRSRAHRLALGGGLGFEDEKFSYLLALKQDSSPAAARIVRAPVVHSHLIDMTLCRPEGIERTRVTRKDKETWRAARKAEWGERWQP